MRITCLVENTQGHPCCRFEHGLSLFIETAAQRILLDAGQTDAALYNASVLGIDLSQLDRIFLSHGHYDHSGSLFDIAQKSGAPVYMQKNAPETHVHGDRNIGIDPRILTLPNLVLLDGDVMIDDELSVFSGITGRRCFPNGNLELETVRDGRRMQDDFAHEQCLVLRQNRKSILLSGCAHNGILNILDRFTALYGDDPDYVITGFHMMKAAEHTEAEKAVIRETAEELKTKKTVYFSGHCTGAPAFELLQSILGDRLIAMHSGEVLLEL